MNDPSFFQDWDILAPKNNIVDLISDYMLSLTPSEDKIYLSFDTPVSINIYVDSPNDVHTQRVFKHHYCLWPSKSYNEVIS